MPVYHRKRLPLDHAVRWSPTHDGYYLLAGMLASSRDAALVCVTQRTLLQVEAHRREESGADCYGLLLGDLYECPKQSVRYLLIDAATRAPRVTSDDPAARAATLSELMVAATRHGDTFVGWYRADTHVVPQAAREDIGLHHQLFPESWHTMLLLGGTRSGRTGAFVRVEPADLRAFPIPFLELLPKERVDRRSRPHTAVLWNNYRSVPDVVILPDLEHDQSSRAASRDLSVSEQAASGLLQHLRSTFGSALGAPSTRADRAPAVTPRDVPRAATPMVRSPLEQPPPAPVTEFAQGAPTTAHPRQAPQAWPPTTVEATAAPSPAQPADAPPAAPDIAPRTRQTLPGVVDGGGTVSPRSSPPPAAEPEPRFMLHPAPDPSFAPTGDAAPESTPPSSVTPVTPVPSHVAPAPAEHQCMPNAGHPGAAGTVQSPRAPEERDREPATPTHLRTFSATDGQAGPWPGATAMVDPAAQDEWFVLTVPPAAEEVARRRAARRLVVGIGAMAAFAMLAAAAWFLAGRTQPAMPEPATVRDTAALAPTPPAQPARAGGRLRPGPDR